MFLVVRGAPGVRWGAQGALGHSVGTAGVAKAAAALGEVGLYAGETSRAGPGGRWGHFLTRSWISPLWVTRECPGLETRGLDSAPAARSQGHAASCCDASPSAPVLVSDTGLAAQPPSSQTPGAGSCGGGRPAFAVPVSVFLWWTLSWPLSRPEGQHLQAWQREQPSDNTSYVAQTCAFLSPCGAVAPATVTSGGLWLRSTLTWAGLWRGLRSAGPRCGWEGRPAATPGALGEVTRGWRGHTGVSSLRGHFRRRELVRQAAGGRRLLTPPCPLLLQMSKVWNDLQPKLQCLFAGPHGAPSPPRSPQDGLSPH